MQGLLSFHTRGFLQLLLATLKDFHTTITTDMIQVLMLLHRPSAIAAASSTAARDPHDTTHVVGGARIQQAQGEQDVGLVGQ